jgi:hypothetical protein
MPEVPRALPALHMPRLKEEYVVGHQSRDTSISTFEVSDANNLEVAAAFFACEVPAFTSVSDTTFYLQPTRAQELLAYSQRCQQHELSL